MLIKEKDFVYLLTSWLAPGVVAHAAQDWSNPPTGHEIVELKFDRDPLRLSSDGKIGWFVNSFLEHFYLSDELRLMSKGFYSQHINNAASRWLGSERLFTGTVKFYDESIDSDTLYSVAAPIYEIRLVWPCLIVLNKLVITYYSYYQSALDQFGVENLHYPPHGEWLFLNWIGTEVAKSCGITNAGEVGIPPPSNMTHMLSNVRGTAVVNGPLPTSSSELNTIAMKAQCRYEDISSENEMFKNLLKP